MWPVRGSWRTPVTTTTTTRMTTGRGDDDDGGRDDSGGTQVLYGISECQIVAPLPT